MSLIPGGYELDKKYKLALFWLVPAAVIGLVLLVANGHDLSVLQPAGVVGQKERNLIIFASLLSLIVVVPVFGLTFWIAWKYRAENTKAKYLPELDGNRLLETIWWTVPLALILVLSVVTWQSSHDLDPYRPLNTSKPPLDVQVVALDWKWLFIYPEQHIATVNYLQFPVNTPINFHITADAPMNSFWIPKLGGQIYAMSGMSTQLHLMADRAGSYPGSSANISGRGFAGMKFMARASSEAEFHQWVNRVKQSSDTLNESSYHFLAQPSENNTLAYFTSDDHNLFDKVVQKYIEPNSPLLGAGLR